MERRLRFVSLEDLGFRQLAAMDEQREHFRKIGMELVAELSRPLREELPEAMALLCKLPIRALDVRTGMLGQEFRRDSEGWTADIVTSKTGAEIKGRLADCLTRYLDAVLLLDTHPRHLWQIYDQRIGTPLFANPARGWKAYEREWLRRNLTERTGHGPHIMRSLIYDACILDEGMDLRVAQALCGHADETSRKFYEINGDRYRRDAALKHLSRIEKSNSRNQ